MYNENLNHILNGSGLFLRFKIYIYFRLFLSHFLFENEHVFPLLEQFEHLQSVLSETDPQLADEVRKQIPD